MSRKRSVSSILDDLDDEESPSNQPSSTCRNRSISGIINEEIVSSARPTSNKRKLVVCNCPDCDGNLVDSRTKEIHDSRHQEYQDSQGTISSQVRQLEIGETSIPASAGRMIDESIRQESEKSDNSNQDDVDDEHQDVEFNFLPQQRARKYTNRPEISEDPEDSSSSEYTTEEDIYSDTLSIGSESDNDPISGISEIFEDYSPPSYEPFQNPPYLESNYDRFLWILLWIMNFRTRFNIAETATETLIKFMKLALCEFSSDDFNDFPDSLYLTRKKLGLNDQFHSFVPCPKCHKLYKKEEVVDFKQEDNPAIMKCQHIEFSNSSVRRSRLCNTALSEKISASTNRTIIRPNLMYPFAGINQQLATMFCRPGSEVADSHLGLMLNLDWFQPYDSTIYSIGVIYAAICNLPRDIRFRRENLLTLGILPGPKEVSLHKVNHYLAPIVNELETLWAGLTLNRTYECENGKRVRGALILVSCNIPAARKICGHVSALVSCHRCEKKANYENGQHNFAGMDDVGYSARDLNEHRQNALGWRRCNSDAARKRFVKETGVRWSELLHLSYFDPIRFITVDPMHCLFLSIAKWIVKRIWIDGGILTPNSLNKIQKKMDEFQIPSDLGRIPGKIHSGEGFTNFTADQWRIFFTIYSTVSLWEHLSDVDRRILNHFVRVCSILVNRILESNLVDEAHRSLIEIVKLIENHHGRDKITPNLHLSLHLRDCSSVYGPLYAFWCFSFERMNGILGSLPNSNRKIESELMRRLMFDKQIENIISSGIEVKGLELLNSQRTIGSLSVTDEFSSDEMHRFWLNSQNIKDSQISGKEGFPGEFLKPVSHNILLSSEMLNLMVEYYNATYESFGFRRPLVEGLDNDIIIRVKINQFGRCRIGSEVFGSSLSLRHVKSSYVLAKFITDDEDVDTYPGQIQYYFTHVVDFPDGPVEHFLAYVCWYKHANSTNIRYYFSSDEICNVELWNTEFYPISRDCIIPVHHILGRFVPVSYQISNRQNAREYLAVNPISRKYQL
ncbi:hypothetical protein GLOIN_2v1775288 [Rhizophagus irregularis DAOM 181602=DAOM 197198]|nr:hypothetical protein GLOIN_2v1775288 [Rhizophagus irregularis DAOM 181602=DAOM 197198]